MFKHIKYALRSHLNMRLAALGVMVVLSAVFSVCGLSGLYGMGGKITAVSLVSLALCGLIVVNIIAGEKMIRELFAPPDAYLTALTPQPGWKILLGHVVSIVVWDLASLVVGIFGVVVNSLILADFAFEGQSVNAGSDLYLIPWGLLLLTLFYTMAVLAVIFGYALTKSYLFRLRGRAFLGFLSVCALLYVFSLLDIVLSPFVAVYRWGLFTSLSITIGWNPGMLLFFALTAAKLAALFFVTARLLERKGNI